jgi:hypothetical protein
LYRLLIVSPPLLDQEQYPDSNIRTLLTFTVLTSIIFAILILLPPTTVVSEAYEGIFSVLVSLLWLLFYVLMIRWILSYEKLESNALNIKNIVNQRRTFFHIVLSFILAIYWFAELLSLILVQEAIFNNDIINISFIFILILFLLNQILLFFTVSKFAYKIFG